MSRGTVSFKEALSISRPFGWIVSGGAFTAGAFLAVDEISLRFIIGIVYFSFSYNILAHGVNDIFDHETDIRNDRRAHQVLPKVKHSSLWRWILAANLPFILYFLAVGNIESNVFLFMMVYLVFAYSVTGLRYKEIPFIDSLTSAFLFTSPFIFAMFLLENPDLWAAVFAAFYFWAVGTHAFAAIQDIGPDKAAGVRTIATFLGGGKTIIFTILAFGLAITAPVLAYGFYGLAAAIAVGPYLLTVLSTWHVRKNPEARQFKSAWRRFLILNYLICGVGVVTLIYLYNR